MFSSASNVTILGLLVFLCLVYFCSQVHLPAFDLSAHVAQLK